MNHPRHLYLHIPFCQRRCSYCDFNTYANMEDRIEAYVQALCAELALLATDLLPAPAASPTLPEHLTSAALRPTVFFGGGTPSMLALEQIERILHAAATLVPLEAAEVTMEANPGSVMGNNSSARDYLRGLRGLGVNRLSLGVQTLHDPTLRVLGRTHTADEAFQCFETAREAGFENISLDFMFGLPGQTLAQWKQALATITTWGTEHFSLYSLILEESTPLFAQVTGGRVSVPDDDTTAAMYEHAMECLDAAGYVQYEISNWARTGTDLAWPALPLTPIYACQHNLAYWLNSDYLAAGAGAHGHVYPRRFMNILGINDYIGAVRAGNRPLREEIALTARDLSAETMFMGLRLNSGVDREHFRQRCGVDLDAVYGPMLRALQEQGLIEQNLTHVRLTRKGRMLGNRVFSEFVS
jgi:oxygen-independent coproporphyrinogen-3 oxidase